jgi:hypothetical protein
MKTAIKIGLRCIPPANHRWGGMSEVARHGKPWTIKPPDKAMEIYRKALQKRLRDTLELIETAATPEEAEYWRTFL